MTSAEQYDQIIVNCFRFLGITELETIERMTLWEYNLRMKAYSLKSVDREYEIHLAAWVNREVEAKRKSGKNMKYIYRKWREFFDYEKRIADITGEKLERPETIADKLRRYNREKNNG